MNLGDIESVLYDRFGHRTAPDSSITRRYRQHINTAHREILGQRAFSKLRRAVLPVTCVSQDPFMVLPQAATFLLILVDRTNLNDPLDEITLQDLRVRDPRLSMSGNPDAYVIMNYSAAVAKDPSAATSLYVISDDAADGSGLSVNVEGVVTGGYFRRASVAMNGLTQVNVSSTISTWTSIRKFYLSGPAKGNVSILQGSAGPELGRISPGRAKATYTQLQLTSTPSSAITYYADVEVHVEDMSVVTDEPLLPIDFHWLLECKAIKRELEKRGKSAEWNIEHAREKNGIADLRAFLARKGGVARGPNRFQGGIRPFSQLGPNFPAGT